jgi:hypothetical protein
MSPTDGLLILIVIILTVVLLGRRQKPAPAPAPVTATDFPVADPDAKGATVINPGSKSLTDATATTTATAITPEAEALASNQEHFQACMNGPKLTPDDCDCTGDTFDYAVHEYGGAGMSYKDWVATQSIDKAVVDNHASFVKDRLGDNDMAVVTGRTYALPDHESYQPTPWIGIRGRPRAVAICNPTEVVDDDISYYATKDKLTWTTGN